MLPGLAVQQPDPDGHGLEVLGRRRGRDVLRPRADGVHLLLLEPRQLTRARVGPTEGLSGFHIESIGRKVDSSFVSV